MNRDMTEDGAATARQLASAYERNDSRAVVYAMKTLADRFVPPGQVLLTDEQFKREAERLKNGLRWVKEEGCTCGAPDRAKGQFKMKDVPLCPACRALNVFLGVEPPLVPGDTFPRPPGSMNKVEAARKVDAAWRLLTDVKQGFVFEEAEGLEAIPEGRYLMGHALDFTAGLSDALDTHVNPPEPE